MNTYQIYKGIKDRLKTVAPGFYYLGQYLKGKDNTSYIVPAIYVEMPQNMALTFFPGKIQAARGAQVKIHLVTNAPYKNHDTPVQDSALAEHQAKLEEIDRLLTGWVLKNENGKLLTQQFIPVGASILNYEAVKVYSVLTFQTEFYSYHLR